MVPDRQKVPTDGWTDGMDGRTDGQTDGRMDAAKTISLRLRRGIIRDIRKVLSMVFYLSNQFTNPIMFGIILKNYLSALL